MIATRYSDIIELRAQKQAYNIKSEEAGAWKEFIANDLFTGLLRKVVASVRNNDVGAHRSFWVDGTYGSGKSHAAAVITHLLCDTPEEAMEYVDAEYADTRFAVLREDIRQLRGQKRLLPVKLYGQSKIAQESDMSLQVQQAVKDALSQAGLSIVVRTDFDNYVDSIDEQPGLWEAILAGSPDLRSVAPDLRLLRQKLSDGDMDTLNRVRRAEAEVGVNVRLRLSNLERWLLDVQQQLRAQSDYKGLLIVWDEFTEVMRSSVGLRLLTPLQAIAETFMRTDNDSYFLFITHPSAFDKLENKDEATKTKGRYHYVHYNMETVSAFKIMSHKFKVRPEAKNIYFDLYKEFYADKDELLSALTRDSLSADETRRDLMHIFPIHPMTANLATYYASVVGSSTRSVFDFMGSPLVRQFLDDTAAYASHATATADMLWDFVMDELAADSKHFGPVMERWNTYHIHTDHEGGAVAAVFKGLLLLNALNNVGGGKSTTTPSKDNIRRLFTGTPIEDDVDDALTFISDNSIVQCSPLGEYSVQFSALPAAEVQTVKARLKATEFKQTSQVAKYDGRILGSMEKLFAQVARPLRLEIYSEAANDTTLLSSIDNGHRSAAPYELFVALMLGATRAEISHLREVAERATFEKRFSDVVFIVADEPLGERELDNFIEYMALHAVAQGHSLPDQMKANAKSAGQLLEAWAGRIRGNSMWVYVQGRQEVLPAARTAAGLNAGAAPAIFNCGPEALELIRDRSSSTAWKKQTTKTTVDTMIMYDTKTDILAHVNAQAQHINYLLQDSVDDFLAWKPDVDKRHPLYMVCQKVKDTFDHINRSVPFHLGDQLEYLTRAPYGLYPSFAGMAMVAFALRTYSKPFYDTNGKPHEKKQLVDDVVDMFRYWDEGKRAPGLNVQFESKESGEICRLLKDVFSLSKLPGYSNVSSLKDARWAITHEYCRAKGAPLWALKYAELDDVFRATVANVVEVCTDIESGKRPDLLRATVDGVKRVREDLKNIVKTDGIFRRGFDRYMLGVENVDMREDELDEAFGWLRQNMEGEIGLWREDEVARKLNAWRIDKLRKSAKPAPDTTDKSDDYPDASDTPGPIANEDDMQIVRTSLLSRFRHMDEARLRTCIETIVNDAGTDLLALLLRHANS